MSRVSDPSLLKSMSIHNILESKNKDTQEDELFIPQSVNLDSLNEQKEGIVSDQGDLGVRGIDVPISGILGGRVGQKYFYKQAESGMQIDLRPQQITTSDMTNKVKMLESERPNFTVGIDEKNRLLKLKELEDRD